MLWGSSTGIFSISTFTVPGTPSAITSAGIDSDGINDLVVVGTVAGSGVVQTLHNLPGVGMTLAAQYPGPDNPLGVVSGDFNGDGRPDLAVFNSTTLSIILGNHQPGPGVNVTAVAGVGSATVTWTPALDDGGSAITGYTVTSSGGATLSVGANVTGSFCTAWLRARTRSRSRPRTPFRRARRPCHRTRSTRFLAEPRIP